MKTPPALGKAAVQAWYDEMRFGGYNFDSQQGPSAQNFAQIVWESTTHMGAVLAQLFGGAYSRDWCRRGALMAGTLWCVSRLLSRPHLILFLLQ